MLRVVQIVTATKFVQAVVRPIGPLIAPAGMTFMQIADDAADPCGQWYVNGAFTTQDPNPAQ
jgi:hypothetical protein